MYILENVIKRAKRSLVMNITYFWEYNEYDLKNVGQSPIIKEKVSFLNFQKVSWRDVDQLPSVLKTFIHT